MIEVGAKFPEFALKNQDEVVITLDTIKGKKAIFFAYPKDNTPGCTAAACSIRDHYSELRDAGYELYGLSPDSAQKHKKFIDKFGFQYDLLADTEKELLNALGAWGEKKFLGKTYDGVLRSTFIVDENGTITDVINKVKTKTHAEQLLDLIHSN